jgi:hypothetical protein
VAKRHSFVNRQPAKRPSQIQLSASALMVIYHYHNIHC